MASPESYSQLIPTGQVEGLPMEEIQRADLEYSQLTQPIGFGTKLHTGPNARFAGDLGSNYFAYVYNKEFHVINRNIKRLAGLIDPEDAARRLNEKAREVERETAEARSKLATVNDALQAGQATLELSRDVAPLLAKMERILANQELMSQRVESLEKSQRCGPNGCCYFLFAQGSAPPSAAPAKSPIVT